MIDKIPNVHPGEILEEEFLKPLQLTAYRLAKETHLSPTRISEIIRKKRRITADTAIRFSKYFGNSADFWLGIQNEYDLREEFEKHKKDFESIKKLKVAV
jgi:addiction module HigA family antidote